MIRVQSDDFDVGEEVKYLTQGRHDVGAVVSFVGLVRDNPDGPALTAMTLEHYPGMTERKLEEIEAEAHRRWDLTGSLIIHRHGRLLPGDQIVLVVTTSAHRQNAFDAANFLMDYLKTDAPFWKLEESEDGKGWVAARASDEDAKGKW